MPPSPEQQADLELLVEEAEVETGLARHWWLGATDVGREGEWYWPHALARMEWADWKQGEPNNWGSLGENYAELWPASGYKWNDYTHDRLCYSICQIN